MSYVEGSPSTQHEDDDDDRNKSKRSKKEFGDIGLEVESEQFKAPPVHIEWQKIDDLPSFLTEYGNLITNLYYIDQGFAFTEKVKKDEDVRQLIIKHCSNISQVKFEFTEYPDQVDDDNSQRLVKFLAALAPGLSSLETINNVIGLHYLSCMGYVYENFSNKIKFVKSDELKPEELSVLSGDNNNQNPALTLEELIYNDNHFLHIKKRVHQTPEELALKPKSLVDLVQLTNLRRIDLPFFLTKDKIKPVTALPLLTYACIRLLSTRRGKTSVSSFVENIGRALANVTEIKLYYLDPGLLVLSSILKNCNKLEKLDVTYLFIDDDYNMGLAQLAGVKMNFKQLYARITYSHPYSFQIHLALFLINNVKSLTKICISEIEDEKIVDDLIAASIGLAEGVQHGVELILKLSSSSGEKQKTKVPKEHPKDKPDNLEITIVFYDC